MDQIIDANMARAIQSDTARRHVLSAWIIQRDLPDHQGKYVARLTLDHPTVYVMAADTLADLRAMLPPGLDLSPRMPDDPPDVLEIWLSPNPFWVSTGYLATGRQPVIRCSDRRSGSWGRIQALF